MNSHTSSATSSATSSTRVAFCAGLSLLAALWLPGSSLLAEAPGAPDPDFGLNGKTTIAFNLGGDHLDAAVDVEVLEDGKAIVAGYVQFGATDYDFGLVRIDEQGNLDTSFGSGGAATLPFDLGTGLGDYAKAMAVQSDGKIVVVGGAATAEEGNDDAVVGRLTAEGLPDPTFADDGKLSLAIDLTLGDADFATDVAIQPDGKIVVVGTAFEAVTSSKCFVVRLLADGQFDTSFDGDGTALVIFGSGSSYDTCEAVALQPDGKILVAGSSATTAPIGSLMAVARLTSTGTLDNSFSSDGKTTLDFAPGLYSFAHDLALMDDGRIVVAGGANPNGTMDFAAARLTASGALDGTFGGGKVTLDFAGGGVDVDVVNAVLLQSDGAVLLSGDVDRAGFDYDFGIARFDVHGVLDPAFGPGGSTTVAFDNGQDNIDLATSMAQRADGRILVVGRVDQSSAGDADFGLVQLLGDQIFSDGLEGGDLSAWSASMP